MTKGNSGLPASKCSARKQSSAGSRQIFGRQLLPSLRRRSRITTSISGRNGGAIWRQVPIAVYLRFGSRSGTPAAEQHLAALSSSVEADARQGILLAANHGAGEPDYTLRSTAYELAEEVIQSFGRRHELDVERRERGLKLGPAGDTGLAPSVPMNGEAAALGTRASWRKPVDLLAEQIVGRRVIGLPDHSQPAAHRAEGDEVPQRIVASQLDQGRCGDIFGGEGLPHMGRLLATKGRIMDNTGSVQDAFDRTVDLADLLQNAIQILPHRNVAGVIGDGDARGGAGPERAVDLDGFFDPAPFLVRRTAGGVGLSEDAVFELFQPAGREAAPRGINVRMWRKTEQVEFQAETAGKRQRGDRRDPATSARNNPSAAWQRRG